MATLPATGATTADALAAWDALDPVDVAFMLGAWSGRSWRSGHPLDGVLEAYGWHGKRFDDADTVHPLVFDRASGAPMRLSPGRLAPLLPALLGFAPLRTGLAARLARPLLAVFATQAPGGRLRMMRYRGRDSATLVYDRLALLDVFRRVDDDTVLGLTDLRGMPRPYFFVLRREVPARGGAAGV
ncbi:DUF4334 domain-containing protein [Ramlibacter sp. AW1]|uniref:DUF4334 domain-containing protein n=1 Tax=Ramlibacter aurantiacus TaxID=2801330 RepID=A0A937D5Q5_9BURK|nr:DUF4334 domain-containing protein [Ramlibacter aurantiacus]MBL0418986.1 DUF4334 domain-containing protein [Ramlibacter aurantiacus]